MRRMRNRSVSRIAATAAQNRRRKIEKAISASAEPEKPQSPSTRPARSRRCSRICGLILSQSEIILVLQIVETDRNPAIDAENLINFLGLRRPGRVHGHKRAEVSHLLKKRIDVFLRQFHALASVHAFDDPEASSRALHGVKLDDHWLAHTGR